MNETEYLHFFPEHAREAVDTLRRNGFDAYFVGGCVRDFYMNRAPHDFDITTNAKSGEILSCFEKSGKSACLKGGACGTVGVGKAADEIEITPYRTESGYYDHRHPDHVTFVECISEDLARRDFTVNSLAVGFDRFGHFGLIDLFDGRNDIHKKRIRCVGDARTRFDEDALRMLRAVRFAATLDFSITDETKDAMREKLPLLSYISGERKSEELRKLLSSDAPERTAAESEDVLSFILGKISPHGLNGVQKDFGARLFYLTRNQSDEEFSRRIPSLKLSGDERNALEKLRRIYRRTARKGIVPTEALASVIAEYGYFAARYFGVFPSAEGEKILSSDLPKTLAELKIGGKELGSLGFSGKEIGTALHTLLIGCLEGKYDNTAENLLSAARGIREQNAKGTEEK